MAAAGTTVLAVCSQAPADALVIRTAPVPRTGIPDARGGTEAMDSEDLDREDVDAPGARAADRDPAGTDGSPAASAPATDDSDSDSDSDEQRDEQRDDEGTKADALAETGGS